MKQLLFGSLLVAALVSVTVGCGQAKRFSSESTAGQSSSGGEDEGPGDGNGTGTGTGTGTGSGSSPVNLTCSDGEKLYMDRTSGKFSAHVRTLLQGNELTGLCRKIVSGVSFDFAKQGIPFSSVQGDKLNLELSFPGSTLNPSTLPAEIVQGYNPVTKQYEDTKGITLDIIVLSCAKIANAPADKIKKEEDQARALLATTKDGMVKFRVRATYTEKDGGTTQVIDESVDVCMKRYFEEILGKNP